MRRATACVLALFIAVGPGCRTVLAANETVADATVRARLQHLLDDYVAQRSEGEGISGAALRADIGTRRETVAVFSGTDGLPGRKPIGPETLFQIGSNTKHFTAALILKLEAMGKLDIHQTVGQWLPQYRAWRETSIEALLNMTSDIPNYSETEEIGMLIAADIHHQFAPQDLIAAVDPEQGRHLASPGGWFYSNTNDILAGLIIERASGLSYRAALQTLILEPLHLRDTFYSDGAYPRAVLRRVPRGLYENRDCLLYQPTPCTQSSLAPLLGKDMRTQNLSWAGAAGAMISTPRDLARWIRDLFSLRLFPKRELDEMTAIVSEKTGQPIREVSADDPSGFGLNLARKYAPEPGGAFWFYQGTTLGFRAIFAYWPQHDLVITAMTNSQPATGEDQFGATVVSGALRILADTGRLHTK
jgi:D-alanyl-D-alanine carboxypeptidase